uniref:DUF1772 domain-containing protein n=1 Tax=Saccharothrix mutabilis TaxID=33921 RepID=UPI0031E2C572
MSKIRVVSGAALLATGLLAGIYTYGAVNVASAFDVVPLDVRLTFHTALMRVNGRVVQGTMAVAVLGSLVLAVLVRGRARWAAAGAAVLAFSSFLITMFGNVPINGRIKQWAVGTPPADYAAILDRWEAFNIARTLAALTAFVLVIAVTTRPSTRPEA